MGPLRWSQALKIMGNARTCLHVDGQTEYSRYQGHALHLVGPARFDVLWAIEIEWNHHRGRYRTPLMRLNRALKEKRPKYLCKTRQSYPQAWQCSVTCHKTGQDILGNAEMGGLTLPAVLYRRCSFQVVFFSTDDIQPGSSTFPLL